MPERSPRPIFALITERAMCLTCIATQAGTTENVANDVLESMESRVRLYREHAFPCEACGVLGPVSLP